MEGGERNPGKLRPGPAPGGTPWASCALRRDRLELLKGAAEARANKLTHGEYETEATWSTRKYTPFVMQRISVAVQIAAASEIRLAIGVGQVTAVA